MSTITGQVSAEPLITGRLAAELRGSLARVERGQVVDLGSFARYADDKDAVPMLTAHRVGDVLHHLGRAAQRMQAAREAASPGLRKEHGKHLARHLKHALKAAHGLTSHIRGHYPDEAAELEAVKQDIGLARGYELNPRSGMISLDLPPGTIAPVPDGVSDHHITVVYLGPDVDDEAFAQAQDRAKAAAAAMPGPLTGTVGGIGTFPPSKGSDGKVPAWAGVVLPGSERLRSALEDLSASEHPDWKPHVTLAYTGPGEPLPAPVPQTPVTFTHLSVHRGDNEVARFPLGGSATGLANVDAGSITAQFISLAKAVSDDARAATTAHLTETTLHELAHASRHARQMNEDTPDAEWEFNADHCAKHLGGAAEHAGKLAEHLRGNYPAEGKWLTGLGNAVTPGEGGTGKQDGAPQHARYSGKGTITAQMAAPQALGARVLDLVGPKGYIHNWVFVGVPEAGDRVYHPSTGHGTVASHTSTHVRVKWDSGAVHEIPRATVAPAFPTLSGTDALHAVKAPGGLTAAEKDALGTYGHSRGYTVVNPFLHHDGQVYDRKLKGYRPATQNERNLALSMIAGLDGAFAKAPRLTQPLSVHRGTGDVEAMFGPPGSKTGKTFRSLAYTSTTTAAGGKPGNGYDYESKPGRLTITVPAGAKVLPGNAHENELILPRGAAFKVLSDQQQPNGTRHIHLEYQP